MNRALWWLRSALYAVALSTLSYCAYVALDTWKFQRDDRRQFDSMLTRQASAPPQPPAANGVIGLLDIPRLGISVMVIEGADSTALRRAAGHISGTALPGEQGNVGISAHRDTFFRRLRNIRQRDVITVNTLAGEYRYRVVSTRIVSPTEVSVLDPAETEILTLVTCYPFYYVGAAPDRFVVRAERII
jgi:sortase A